MENQLAKEEGRPQDVARPQPQDNAGEVNAVEAAAAPQEEAADVVAEVVVLVAQAEAAEDSLAKVTP